MLLRQTILYLPAQLVGPLAQLVSVVLWTYFLSPAELGAFALVVAAQELACTTVVQWFTLYTMRYFDKGAAHGDKLAFLNSELGVLAAAGVVTAISILAMPLFVTSDWTPELAGAAVVYSVSRSVATHLADRARATADAMSYSILQVLWPVAALVFGLLLIKLFSPTAATLLWGYTAAQLLALAWAARRLEFGRSLRVSGPIISVAARYALPLVVGGVFVWCANNGVRFVVERSEGTAAVGLVTVGWGLGLRATITAALLVSTAAFPLAVQRLRQQGIAGGQQQLIENGVLLLAALAPATAGLWAISKPLVGLAVAEPFRTTTVEVLPWAIVAGVARNLRIHFGQQVFLLREEPLVPLAADIVDGIATIIGAMIGIAVGGLTGCIMGAAAGATLALVVTLLWGALRHRFVFPLVDFVKISGAALLMVLTLSVFNITPHVLSLICAIVAGAAVYGAAMAALYPDRARSFWDKSKVFVGL